MKLGIYGDSFATGSAFIENWYDHLAKMLGGSATSYGHPATSTFYSFEIFKEKYKKYDLNIFLVTHNDKNLSKRDVTVLNDLRSWFLSSDESFLKVAQDLIVDEIRRLCPDVILIPCWSKDSSMSTSKHAELNIKETGNCETFFHRQLEWFGIYDLPSLQENPKKVGCHFTVETNKAFAECVYNLIKYNTSFECPATIPHRQNFDFYFKKII
jgi:hypothetical protein